jgi:uncharacterized protein
LSYDGAMKSFLSILNSFKYPILVLIGGVALGGAVGGVSQALVVAVLVVLEISLSFDNAVINATILRRMNAFWQRIFMTLGMVIAVLGMRLVFPIVIVSTTAGLGFGVVVDLILHHPVEYAEKLHAAHPAIAAFGGAFLLMIFLDFLLDEAKKVHWLEVIEEPLAEGGRLKTLSSLIALVALLVVSATWAGEEAARVLTAGVMGLVAYLSVRGFSQLFEQLGGVAAKTSGHESPAGQPLVQLAGRAAFFLFLYLEVLDASFSFDGVIGAFAITSNVLTIAIGLGVGAFFVRELTVWLVRHNTLSEFVYLEHGAHYAVGALAVLLAVSLRYDIPDVVTGLVGAAFISASLVSSLRARRRQQKLIS